ncbi:SLATT domain-containing protein [Myxococcaceae bacterium GXIMD 01537]
MAEEEGAKQRGVEAEVAAEVLSAPDHRLPKKADIQIADLELKGRDLAALEAFYEQVLNKAKSVALWYRVNKHKKRWWAIRLRVGAIVLGGLATLTPTVVMLFKPLLSDGWASTLPLLASIFAVMAATMALLDRFFGHSSAWIRYESTFQSIEALTESFELNWARLRMKLPTGTELLPEARLSEFIDTTVTFLQALHEEVRLETQAWVAEFRTSLADLERTVDTQRGALAAAVAPAARGGLQITVEGMDALEGREWHLQVGDRDPASYVGSSTAALTNLEAGLARVKVSGRVGGREVQEQRAVSVEAGKVTEVRLKLG